ncbi:cation-translocating P-type ATPase [Helicobacter sp. MIT 14-3879]|uniref:heavy metal translocating P-type ATPase n=1 Tax=Helicobacter sp. MIT 14-3879 TaxID=2040649 RepID=UPI000E1F1BA5|nr:heavy metal translocating P-type ATPase [Helicobacter sp. MIT 14-3879]RDU61265.1 copper-transporting ATPase [Helicobacter sp. MIT 14-3879]
MSDSDNNAIQEKTIRLQIEGMNCTSCSASIERALKKEKGIIEANVFILSHSGVVHFDSKQCSISHIIEIIRSLGFQASVSSKTFHFNIPTPHISNKNILFKSTHSKTLPFQQDTISLEERLASKNSNNPSNESPSYNTQSCKDKDSVNNFPIFASFFHKLSKTHDFLENHLLSSKRRLILSLLFSTVILYISMFHEMFGLPLPALLNHPLYNGITQLGITLIVMHLAREFYFRGIRALLTLRPNMDSLVSVGSLAGFSYSLYVLIMLFMSNMQELGTQVHRIESHDISHFYFESVCVILSFIMLGKSIEENAKRIANQNAKDLLSRQSNTAQKILNPKSLQSEIPDCQKDHLPNNQSLQIQEVPLNSLKIGDYIQILPHSFIPVDALLCSPHASIDESMLSGESLPVNKDKDSQLFAGTLNLDTLIIARATSTTEDSTLTKIHTLIQQTYESKAQIAQLADKIAAFFVPLVMGLAILSALFWFVIADMQTAMLYFASTLLISCPCALGLATPMAILFANARANKWGVFFKNAQSLENLTKTDYLIFDKTGTLTDGNLTLHSIVLCNNTQENNKEKEELLRICASIESASNHIIAQAICRAASHLTPYKVLKSKSILNAGIESTLQIDSKARHFVIGNTKILKEICGIETNLYNHTENPYLCIYIAEKQANNEQPTLPKYQLLGSIFLQENIREDAQALIQRVKNMGFTCEILSGDNTRNVAYIANILQMNYRAECSPQDKLHYIESLQKKGHSVIMVGDGINDAIALAKADVSLVMASGSEVSIEYGNIIYFNKKLLRIAESLQLGRATFRNIKQNLTFAFVYNVICIPIAMGVFSSFGVVLNPMLASLAMSLSSISVVGNASRLYSMRL